MPKRKRDRLTMEREVRSLSHVMISSPTAPTGFPTTNQSTETRPDENLEPDMIGKFHNFGNSYGDAGPGSVLQSIESSNHVPELEMDETMHDQPADYHTGIDGRIDQVNKHNSTHRRTRGVKIDFVKAHQDLLLEEAARGGAKFISVSDLNHAKQDRFPSIPADRDMSRDMLATGQAEDGKGDTAAGPANQDANLYALQGQTKLSRGSGHKQQNSPPNEEKLKGPAKHETRAARKKELKAKGLTASRQKKNKAKKLRIENGLSKTPALDLLNVSFAFLSDSKRTGTNSSGILQKCTRSILSFRLPRLSCCKRGSFSYRRRRTP
jgi:hypothetical protein